MVVASGNTAEQQRPSSASARLIDKDDPRSRLHYVKYLKRDGKTLKIWECGICNLLFCYFLLISVCFIADDIYMFVYVYALHGHNSIYEYK